MRCPVRRVAIHCESNNPCIRWWRQKRKTPRGWNGFILWLPFTECIINKTKTLNIISESYSFASSKNTLQGELTLEITAGVETIMLLIDQCFYLMNITFVLRQLNACRTNEYSFSLLCDFFIIVPTAQEETRIVAYFCSFCDNSFNLFIVAVESCHLSSLNYWCQKDIVFKK